MNFLEKLASEWYEYGGYFCKTNIRFGQTGHGGHIGEMDVVAYHPKTKEFIHVECSADAWSWERKKEVFVKKFQNAHKFYDKMFSFKKSRIRKIAITGFSYPREDANKKMNFGNDIEIMLVPDFITSITSKFSKLDPWSIGINENSYPLLRAIQYGTFYLLRKLRKNNSIDFAKLLK